MAPSPPRRSRRKPKSQLGLDIDKKKIQLKETIKTLGTHNVPVKLHPKVTVELKVVVTEEA